MLGFEALAVKPSHDPVPEPDYRPPPSRGAVSHGPWHWPMPGSVGSTAPTPRTPKPPTRTLVPLVVTLLLERGDADRVVVTNGKLWRLYSRRAHSRSTIFYEVDLEDALLASGQSDPNEAFRYWWLFFRAEAFAPASAVDQATWLDRVAAGSREYAREVEGAELKRARILQRRSAACPWFFGRPPNPAEKDRRPRQPPSWRRSGKGCSHCCTASCSCFTPRAAICCRCGSRLTTP